MKRDQSLYPDERIVSRVKTKEKTDAQTLSAQNNVSQPRVGHPRHTLLPIIKCDVPHICLHLLEIQRDAMMAGIGDSSIWRKLDIVVGFDSKDVREEISALERQVLNDEVESIVCIFNAWDRDVSDLISLEVSQIIHVFSTDFVPD